MNNTKPGKCVIVRVLVVLMICALAAPTIGQLHLFNPASLHMSLNVNEHREFR